MSWTRWCTICGDSETSPAVSTEADDVPSGLQLSIITDDNDTAEDEQIVTLHDMSCGAHAICTACFVQAAEHAVQQERHWPIPCGNLNCEKHPESLIETVLQDDHPDLLAKYLEKCEEYETPHQTRVYCASKECASTQGVSPFLNTRILGGNQHVTCPHCNKITCIACKESIATDGSEQDHECSAGEQEKSIRDYLISIPEHLRWLYQRCYRCRVVVEKTMACNHMTCFCGAQFCLICGGKWNDIEACGNGCRKSGHDQWDPQDDIGADEDYDDDDPFDEFGMDADGFDRDGFDDLGYNRNGFNAEGRDRDGYDLHGWDREGFNRDRMSFTGLAYSVYDLVGYGEDLNSDDEAEVWLETAGGYDPWGYDAHGYDANGIDRTGRDRDGYDLDGRDRQGFDREGRNTQGIDRRGFNIQGYDDDGFDQHHRSADGDIAPQYHLTSDGNVRRRVLDLPFAAPEIFGCHHTFIVRESSSTCGVCSFGCSWFHYRCTACGGSLCDYCTSAHNRDPSALQDRVRLRDPFPDDDGFGLPDFFTVEKHETTFYIAEMFAMIGCQGEGEVIEKQVAG